jgi:single-strand DNA-binding protein
MAGRSVNKVILLGHLGRDAETKHTGSGIAVTKFSLATSRRIKDSQTGDYKDETEWHNAILWRAENLANFLTKGKQVYVEGRLQTRQWEKDGVKHYSTEVVVDEIVLLGGKSDGADQPDRPVSAPRSSGSLGTVRDASRVPDAPAMFDDGDVPF